MKIIDKEVIQLLIERNPEINEYIKSNNEELDLDALSLTISVFARYTKKLIENNQISKISNLFDTIEATYIFGDETAKNLIVYLIEYFNDISLQINNTVVFEKYLGRNSKIIWDKVETLYNQKQNANAIDKSIKRQKF